MAVGNPVKGIHFASARAQETSDKAIALVFQQPDASAKEQVLARPAGQIVFAPPDGKWYQSATKVKIAIFDALHAQIIQTTTDDNGSFLIAALPPGRYTLVTGARPLQILSVPLRIRPSAPSERTPGPGLMLYLREKSDKHRSSIAKIEDMALRADILKRAANDQRVRNEMIARGVTQPNKEARDRVGAVDNDNLAAMKSIVSRFGLPGPDLVGVDGADAAFLLIQHAPLNFQEEMLPKVEQAYRKGNLSGQSYALLLDRVRVREGKKQIYGTQGADFKEWKNGEAALSPIEDEAHVDQRRAEVGLMPLAEYKKMLSQMYMPKGATAQGSEKPDAKIEHDR